ncbi:MAG: hypothetical protein GY775_17390 [Candidatus Scalindua sp.]|nr:hypothetical protein [Candidatus Scalindua sp.]
MRIYNILFAVSIVTMTLVSPCVYAETTANKTPSDVYAKVILLKKEVDVLRKISDINEEWPVVEKQIGKSPRHVLQKTLEVLDKINRLRRIREMGPITVPPYPSRKISPNEVFDMVERLVDEVRLFIPDIKPEEEEEDGKAQSVKRKTPNDVYRELWGVSRAIDPVLGIRGLLPADVYEKAMEVLETVRFLSTSQNLSWKEKTKPPLTEGNHPNHSLIAVNKLLDRIAMAERNLWITPVLVQEVPMRVIEPQEVFDALNIVDAELQRIKFRLGLERHLPTVKVKGDKTPDDVIQILQWATLVMPDFSNKPIIQYNPIHIEKTPDHVFAVSEHNIAELKKYKNYRGIKTPVRDIPSQSGMQPKHVYQKALECLSKISRLRMQLGLGRIVVPEYPLRRITPTEVYELAVRLDTEMEVVYEDSGLDCTPVHLDIELREYSHKAPTDVFTNMWSYSFMLDTIIGSEGYTPSDVYLQASRVRKEIKLIASHLSKDIEVNLTTVKFNRKPSDVIVMAREVRSLLNEAKKHAGIFESRVVYGEENLEKRQISPDDVFNEVGLILAEIIELKLHLGITEVSVRSSSENGKTPSDVYRQLEMTKEIIKGLLNS